MALFEVILRAQVKKELKDHSLSAVANVLATALKYQLVLPPSEAHQIGGVLIWRRLLTAKFGDDLFGKVPKVKTDSNDDPDDKPN